MASNLSFGQVELAGDLLALPTFSIFQQHHGAGNRRHVFERLVQLLPGDFRLERDFGTYGGRAVFGSPVPEPASLGLMSSALEAGAIVLRRRRTASGFYIPKLRHSVRQPSGTHSA